jgi:hypothetical protein
MFVEIVQRPEHRLFKAFNAERYAALNIAPYQTNEIIAQMGRLVKSRTGPFAAYQIQHTTLMERPERCVLPVAHASLRMPEGGPIFDGFLLTSTNGNTPLPIVDVPMIQMPTQTEVVTWRNWASPTGGPTAMHPETVSGCMKWPACRTTIRATAHCS